MLTIAYNKEYLKNGYQRRNILNNFNDLGFNFKKAGLIFPTMNGNTPFTYKSYDKASPYYERNNYQIMRLRRASLGITTNDNEKIGDQEFCHISVTDDGPCQEENGININLPDRTGVYLWVINDIVVYVGRAHTANQTLYRRFRNGYNRITPRACVCKINEDGRRYYGQITNMKMNRLVLNSYRSQQKISIYYHECENADEVENQLIDSNWQHRIYKENEHYTLMYNSRR